MMYANFAIKAIRPATMPTTTKIAKKAITIANTAASIIVVSFYKNYLGSIKVYVFSAKAKERALVTGLRLFG